MPTVIIPLAGPDFFTPKFGVRPLYRINDITLTEYVISKRWWLNLPQLELIFVLREVGDHTAVMKTFIQDKFPNARIIIISHLTRGAPYSAMAGLSLVQDYSSPLIVDLMDIVFECKNNPIELFINQPRVSALIPYFTSNDPKFSYLITKDNVVLKTREKEVISNQASAGVYIFKNPSTYLTCINYCTLNPKICDVGLSSFVCPSINGLIENGDEVLGIKVVRVQPISTLFHI